MARLQAVAHSQYNVQVTIHGTLSLLLFIIPSSYALGPNSIQEFNSSTIVFAPTN